MRGKRYQHVLFTFLIVLFIHPTINLHKPVFAEPTIQGSEEAECKFSFINTTFGDNQTSGDGRYTVFQKISPFPGASYSLQVFVYDKINRTTEQVSLSWDGKSMLNNDDYSSYPTISGNGIYVVFFSGASGLVQDPNVQGYQLYQRDRVKMTTSIVSVGINGPGRGDPKDPYLSQDGRYLVFDSLAENLVAGDTNGTVDAFIRDQKLGITELVSVASDGSQGVDYADHGHLGSAVSDDGRYVVFSYSSLKDNNGEDRSGLFIRDRNLKKTYWIGPGYSPTITPDGKFITFVSMHAFVPQDNNEKWDTYLYDRTTGAFELISLRDNGIVSTGGSSINRPAISADGSEVAFISDAIDIIQNDQNNEADVFLRNRITKSTVRLTVDNNGYEANGPSFNVSMSNDGRTISISSQANNLADGAPSTQYEANLYLCERAPKAIEQENKVYIPMLGR